ncbi:unnamed protein product [Adineta ricciae]|uniref:Uncharacterized protein n=1 Tax=Adineta ricciae TaxID=249248 RepID=A0A815V4J6_ADIRI|nr:unnamed protein product [Adineta ricciae]CAF1529806.1 unnamed protein product [Adineta ricciae]
MVGIVRLAMVFCLLLLACATAMANHHIEEQHTQDRRRVVQNNQGKSSNRQRCVPIDCGLECTKKGFTGSRCLRDVCRCL